MTRPLPLYTPRQLDAHTLASLKLDHRAKMQYDHRRLGEVSVRLATNPQEREAFVAAPATYLAMHGVTIGSAAIGAETGILDTSEACTAVSACVAVSAVVVEAALFIDLAVAATQVLVMASLFEVALVAVACIGAWGCAALNAPPPGVGGSMISAVV